MCKQSGHFSLTLLSRGVLVNCQPGTVQAFQRKQTSNRWGMYGQCARFGLTQMSDGSTELKSTEGMFTPKGVAFLQLHAGAANRGMRAIYRGVTALPTPQAWMKKQEWMSLLLSKSQMFAEGHGQEPASFGTM